jgi:hypothetical protein
VTATPHVHSSWTLEIILKPLLSKSNSENISEPSTDVVAFIGLNVKHPHKINLRYSTKERVRFKNSLFIWDFIQTKSNKIYFQKFKC